MSLLQRDRWAFLVLAVVTTAAVYAGFSVTYIGPRQMFGPISGLPVSVHIHGLMFLAWYALLSVQAALIVAGRSRAQIILGVLSILLVVGMVVSGLVVLGYRMEQGLLGNDPFWAAFGLTVLSNLVLFAGFYVWALAMRSRSDWHRRLMISAAAVGSGAAMFRLITGVVGFQMWTLPAGIVGTNVIILLGMVYDGVSRRSVHPGFAIPFLAAAAIEVGLLWGAHTTAGRVIQEGIVAALKPLIALY